MRTIARVGMALCSTALLSFGVTVYRGQLMDASCYNQNPSNSTEKPWVRCAPTTTTTSFAIHTNGMVRMLDSAGNDKAETALKEGYLTQDKSGGMTVVVAGWRHGNTIKVESVRAHKSNTSIH